jgi:7,8-dihydropterin-6-yl-methyl-4-(beta-D-ribofuranosyl)aminobenzene 5'-phosphate synthase
MKTRILTAACFILIASLFLTAATQKSPGQQEKNATVTILYDNYVFTEGLQSDWGFSCLLKGMEKTILFDTGAKGGLLFENIGKLKINPKDVELVVISHNHTDHTGGLLAFLGKNSAVTVYLPPSCPANFVQQVKDTGAKVVIPNAPLEICKGVHLTGPMGEEIIEQSMIVDTVEGSVVITGCSHPGILDIVQKSKAILPKDIHLVFGGFHLMRKPEDEIEQIISEFRKLGAKRVGPTHCTGDKVIQAFKNAYGEGFLQMGVGRVLEIGTPTK